MTTHSCRVLLTGFAPFAGWKRNPSADAVGALAADRTLGRLGLRTGVLPVGRRESPRVLEALLRELRPATLLMTGLAAGRDAACIERIGVNCWRRQGSGRAGTPILRGGPDGLFSTVPLEAAVAALAGPGLEAVVSQTAGTYACNLVLYLALEWARRGELPGGGAPASRVGFVHVPATAQSRPARSVVPVVTETDLAAGLERLVRMLLRDSIR